MNVVSFVLELILLVWFFGCISTYRFGKVLLVEGMGVKSAEFVMFVLYSVGVALRVFLPNVGVWVVLVILVVWFVLQWFCHWHFTIFGANQRKIDGYNQCFCKTLRIFPSRNDRVIPDLYHIVLHLLIATNIVLLLVIII